MSRAGFVGVLATIALLLLGGYVWVSTTTTVGVRLGSAASMLTFPPSPPPAFPNNTVIIIHSSSDPVLTAAESPASTTTTTTTAQPREEATPPTANALPSSTATPAEPSQPPHTATATPRARAAANKTGLGESVGTGTCSSRIDPGPGAFIETGTTVPPFTQTPLVTFADPSSSSSTAAASGPGGGTQPRFTSSRHCTILGAKPKYRLTLQHIAVPPALSADVRESLCGESLATTETTTARRRRRRSVMLVVTCLGGQADHSYYAVHILWSVFFQLDFMGVYNNSTATLRTDIDVSVAVVLQSVTEGDPHATLLVRMLRALVEERAPNSNGNDSSSNSAAVLVAFQASKLGGEVSIPSSSVATPTTNNATSDSFSSSPPQRRRQRTVCADEVHMGWQAVFIRGGKQYFSLTLPRIRRFQSRLYQWAGVVDAAATVPAERVVQIVIIQRLGTRRRMKGLATLIDALRGLSSAVNITTVHLESSSVAEQVRWFAAADVMVAVHGAAMAAMTMMRPGGLIVELGPASTMRDVRRYFIPGVNVSGTMYGFLASVCLLHHVGVAVPDLDIAEALKRAPPAQQGVSRVWKWAEFPVATNATVSAVAEGVRSWMAQRGS